MMQRSSAALAFAACLLACDPQPGDEGRDGGPAGPRDAGNSDGGRADAGNDDGSDDDAGSGDAGPRDAGSIDAGSTDAGNGPVPTSCGDYTNPQTGVSQSSLLATVYRFPYDESLPAPRPFGDAPASAVVEGPDGNLYGVARFGGVADNGERAAGVVFRTTPQGQTTVLHHFQDHPGSAMYGTQPVGSLVVGPDCALYGTTHAANGTPDGVLFASSTVFRITLEGDLTYVAGFDASTGYQLFHGLTVGSDGNFYGVANLGGASASEDALGHGTVFKLTPQGAVTVLVSFDGSNGSTPTGPLVEGSDGSLYGATLNGGANGGGTIFKVGKDGDFQTLWSSPDWTIEVSDGLANGPDGALYGVTRGGGLHGTGSIFRITPAGEYTTLHSFDGVTESSTSGQSCNCGMIEPRGPLLLARDGNFYGVVGAGMSGVSSGERGGVFRATPAGVVTPVLYFPDGDPGNVNGGLIEPRDGFLYGTADAVVGGGGRVYRVRLPAAGEKLVDDVHSIVDLTFSGDTMIFSVRPAELFTPQETHDLFVCPSTGCGPTPATIPTGSTAISKHVAASPTALFIADASTASLRTCALAGETCGEWTPFPDAGTSTARLSPRYAHGRVYWEAFDADTDTRMIRVCPEAGCGPGYPKTVFGDTTAYRSFVVGDATLFLLNDLGQIESVALVDFEATTGGPSPLIDDPACEVTDIAVTSSDELWWVESCDGTNHVHACTPPLCDGDTLQDIVVSDGATWKGLRVNGDHVYGFTDWVTKDTPSGTVLDHAGQIWRIPR